MKQIKCIAGLNNGGRSGARWDLSPMPTPRPMPILPRPAVASSDFRPYCSPSNLNVVLEPTNPKASRPPLRQTNSVANTTNDQNGENGASNPSMVMQTTVNSSLATRGGSLKTTSMLTAATAAKA